MTKSATLIEMNCPCGKKFISDNVKWYRRINGKPQRVCAECYRQKVEIPIKGSIIKDEKLGNVIKWN